MSMHEVTQENDEANLKYMMNELTNILIQKQWLTVRVCYFLQAPLTIHFSFFYTRMRIPWSRDYVVRSRALERRKWRVVIDTVLRDIQLIPPLIILQFTQCHLGLQHTMIAMEGIR